MNQKNKNNYLKKTVKKHAEKPTPSLKKFVNFELPLVYIFYFFYIISFFYGQNFILSLQRKIDNASEGRNLLESV